MTKVKLTPLFIVLIMLELGLLSTAFYFFAIENKGGMVLGGLIAVIAALLNAIVLVLEQFIVRIEGLSNWVIWVVEIILIACAIIYIVINGISIG